MRDHASRLRPWQAARDIFKREAVKAVAPDALCFEFEGKGKAAIDRREIAMKGGIEAGDLGQFRP